MTSKILILGATSAMAQSIAKIFAANGDHLLLVGRHADRVKSIAQDLQLRGKGQIDFQVLDLNAVDQHEQLLKTITDIDIVIIAYGSLPDQKKCEASFEMTLNELNTNFLSVVSLLTRLANYFENRKKGCIAVITSVAGDRGRQSNYVYGAAKGALSIYLQGLRNRLSKSNVNVLTIKPGFVDTPMIRHLKKGILWASPDYVAQQIVNGIEKKKSVLYVPFFWRYIMLIIKAIPEKIFCRLSM